jgi:outer membrane protein assembly factor BamB
MTSTLLLTLSLLAAPPVDWPQFRGPTGDGHAVAQHLPTTWSETAGVVWKTELPGRGWSSPVVAGGKAWLTTAEETAYTQQQREAKFAANPHADMLQTHAAVTLYALELDLESGKVLRRIELLTVDDPEPIHANNSYATPTPVLADGRLLCDFGSLGTCALDVRTGEVLWTKQLKVNFITGAGSSPVVWRNLMILTRDGADEQYVAALDVKTGDEVWRTPRPKIDSKDTNMHRSFSTPLVITHDGAEQVIVPGAQWLVSYEPATGAERWRVNVGPGYSIVPRPVYGDGLVYACTGFVSPQLWAVRVDGARDVTESHVAWKLARQVSETASPILVGEELFFVSSKGVATCVDAKTGEQRWQERLGGNFNASPLYADGKLYFLSQEGQMIVLNPGRKFEPLARNQLFGQFLASPVAVGERMLLRSDSHLYLIGK